MTEEERQCLYCGKKTIISSTFKNYVCTKCYHKNQVKKSLYILRNQIDAVLNDLAEMADDKHLWICTECGKSTYETEYDYLAARDLHLECAIKKEMAEQRGMTKE